ncbi:MAG: glycosyltransferase family 2 protein [Paracoccaceae bacterium]|nr:glycosyltransferase family 2 protein [Paracoccaceae bacterium]
MPTVTVSIINYRTGALTIACLESVLAELSGGEGRPPIDGNAVVVDNASGDGSAEAIARWLEERPGAPVTLVRSPVNAGFSGGHNQAIARSASEFVVILNSDAELRPGCLHALLAVAVANPGAGLVSARLEGPDGTPQTSCFRSLTPMSEVIRGAATGGVTRLLARWAVPLGPDPDPHSIEWTAFACVLLRREMIDAIGPMDEGFFLYFEDVEYCRRARRAGWQVRHAPQARAVHHVGGSTNVTAAGAEALRRPAWYYAARSRYFYLAGGRPLLYAANLGWLAGRAVARLRLLFGRAVPPAAAAEYRDIWINALRPTGPRHAPADAGDSA